MIDLRQGDCLEVLRSQPSNSVDSLVTDPPAAIGFMGLEFDHHKGGREQWIAWLREILEECQRVMKPGAIGFVWSLPRTQHWTAMACEDAGFEIWDNLGIAHVQGGGFPKGQAIDKLIDKRAGKLGERVELSAKNKTQSFRTGGCYGAQPEKNGRLSFTAPATDEAARWNGWRTRALKPAIEFWIAIQKKYPGTCVDNVQNHGVGGVNIDACRVEGGKQRGKQRGKPRVTYGVYGESVYEPHAAGRYPANFMLQHHPDCNGTCHPDCPVELLGEMSGECKSGEKRPHPTHTQNVAYGSFAVGNVNHFPGDTGTAARYFHQLDAPFTYQAKASPRNRNDGCDGLYWKRDKSSSVGWTPITKNEYDALPERDRANGNIHATVKSTQLMSFFVKLATPPGGTVLDPFAGSGTTGVACAEHGFGFLGIERDPHYLAIAQARIDRATLKHAPPQPTLEERVQWLETKIEVINQRTKKQQPKRPDKGQLGLFG